MTECKLLIRTPNGFEVKKSSARVLYEYGRYLFRNNSSIKPIAIYGAKGRLWIF